MNDRKDDGKVLTRKAERDVESAARQWATAAKAAFEAGKAVPDTTGYMPEWFEYDQDYADFAEACRSEFDVDKAIYDRMPKDTPEAIAAAFTATEKGPQWVVWLDDRILTPNLLAACAENYAAWKCPDCGAARTWSKYEKPAGWTLKCTECAHVGPEHRGYSAEDLLFVLRTAIAMGLDVLIADKTDGLPAIHSRAAE